MAGSPDDGGLWSGPKVAAWMAQRLGLERVHPQRGWEALKRIGWSIQAPRPRHPRAATPERRAAFRGGSTPPSPRPRRRIPTGRSRSGPRTVGRTASDPPGPEADPTPGPGAHRPATDRPRPPPLPVAAPRRLRAADPRRDALVSPRRSLEALLRRTARPLRPRDRRRPRAQHRPRARRCGRAWTQGPARPRRDPPGLPAALFARAPARRAPLAAGGRAGRRPAPRSAGRTRRHRRRTPPPARRRRPPAAHRLPPVAQARPAELITRRRYQASAARLGCLRRRTTLHGGPHHLRAGFHHAGPRLHHLPQALSRSPALAGTTRLGHAGGMPSEPTTYPGYRLPAEVIHH